MRTRMREREKNINNTKKTTQIQQKPKRNSLFRISYRIIKQNGNV